MAASKIKPPPTPASSKRKAATPREIMLDPHGIYGTRTAGRVRAAKRRRAWQGWILALAALIGMGAAFGGRWLPRATSVAPVESRAVAADFSAPPVVLAMGAGKSSLLAPTATGALLLLDGANASVPRRIFEGGFPLRAQPMVDGKTAYAPCEDGALYAINCESGRVEWKYQSGAAMTSRPVLLRLEAAIAAPIVAMQAPNAVVEAPSAPRLAVVVGNDEGEVAALDAQSGRVLWRRVLPAPVGAGLAEAEAVAGHPLILVPLLEGLATRGGLWCLDARTGQAIWKWPPDGKSYAAQLAPPIVGSASPQHGAELARATARVFCGDDGGAVVCLDLSSGRKMWKVYARPAGDSRAANELVSLRAEPLLQTGSDGLTRLVIGGNDGLSRCLNARDGRELWRFDAGAPIRFQAQSVRLAGVRDALLISSDSPTLWLLDAHDGSPITQFQASARLVAAPTVEGSRATVLTQDGHLQTFELPGA